MLDLDVDLDVTPDVIPDVTPDVIPDVDLDVIPDVDLDFDLDFDLIETGVGVLRSEIDDPKPDQLPKCRSPLEPLEWLTGENEADREDPKGVQFPRDDLLDELCTGVNDSCRVEGVDLWLESGVDVNIPLKEGGDGVGDSGLARRFRRLVTN